MDGLRGSEWLRKGRRVKGGSRHKDQDGYNGSHQSLSPPRTEGLRRQFQKDTAEEE